MRRVGGREERKPHLVRAAVDAVRAGDGAAVGRDARVHGVVRRQRRDRASVRGDAEDANARVLVAGEEDRLAVRRVADLIEDAAAAGEARLRAAGQRHRPEHPLVRGAVERGPGQCLRVGGDDEIAVVSSRGQGMPLAAVGAHAPERGLLALRGAVDQVRAVGSDDRIEIRGRLFRQPRRFAAARIERPEVGIAIDGG